MPQTDPTTPLPTRRTLIRLTLRWGLAASLLLHGCLLTMMVFGTVHSWLDQRPIQVIEVSTTYARDDGEKGQTATVVINEDDPAPAGVEQQFQDSLAVAEQLTEEERIDALDAATSRLNRISSEASIDEVAKRLQSWFGLTPRAEGPVAESPGSEDAGTTDPVAVDSAIAEAATLPKSPEVERTFDFETAQLHDVRRVIVPDSAPRYVSVLLDANGRTIEVPMSESEGAPIYSLMEKIKAHPLLDRIYRQLAMPLIDQMVKAKKAVGEATKAATSESGNESARAAPTTEQAVDADPPAETAESP